MGHQVEPTGFNALVGWFWDSALGQWWTRRLACTDAGELNVATATERRAPVEAEIRTAICKPGGLAAVPDSDLSAVASGDLIAWSGITAGKKRCQLNVLGANNAATDTAQLGWWVTVNAGSAVAAKQRLQDALDSTQSTKIAKVVSGASVMGNANKSGWLLGIGQQFSFESDIDITDVYAYPIAQVSGASLTGTSLLTATVS